MCTVQVRDAGGPVTNSTGDKWSAVCLIQQQLALAGALIFGRALGAIKRVVWQFHAGFGKLEEHASADVAQCAVVLEPEVRLALHGTTAKRVNVAAVAWSFAFVRGLCAPQARLLFLETRGVAHALHRELEMHEQYTFHGGAGVGRMSLLAQWGNAL